MSNYGGYDSQSLAEGYAEHAIGNWEGDHEGATYPARDALIAHIREGVEGYLDHVILQAVEGDSLDEAIWTELDYEAASLANEAEDDEGE